jgi:hypothetical protein
MSRRRGALKPLARLETHSPNAAAIVADGHKVIGVGNAARARRMFDLYWRL